MNVDVCDIQDVGAQAVTHIDVQILLDKWSKNDVQKEANCFSVSDQRLFVITEQLDSACLVSWLCRCLESKTKKCVWRNFQVYLFVSNRKCLDFTTNFLIAHSTAFILWISFLLWRYLLRLMEHLQSRRSESLFPLHQFRSSRLQLQKFSWLYPWWFWQRLPTPLNFRLPQNVCRNRHLNLQRRTSLDWNEGGFNDLCIFKRMSCKAK